MYVNTLQAREAKEPSLMSILKHAQSEKRKRCERSYIHKAKMYCNSDDAKAGRVTALLLSSC